MSRHDAGMVYLVGAGAGQPDLITVRAHTLLAACDAIVVNANARLALQDIVDAARHANPLVVVREVPVLDEEAEPSHAHAVARLVRDLVLDGRSVVRLLDGDPFLFSSGAAEARALAAAGVPFEVVPGLPAASAIATHAGIPLTCGSVARRVTLLDVTGDGTERLSASDWSACAAPGATTAMQVRARGLAAVAESLVSAGMSPDAPAAAIHAGASLRQRTVVATISTIAQEIPSDFQDDALVLVVGDVVTLRDETTWFDRRPLFGKCVVVTRASAQASTLRVALEQRGAHVIELPALRIEPTGSAALDDALDRLQEYDWIVFTSRNAVAIVWDAIRAQRRDARAFGGRKIASVGAATSESLLHCGIVADVVPTRFLAEGVLEAMAWRDDVRGSRVLYLAAEGARDVLPIGLRRLDCAVDVVHVYRSVNDGTGAGILRDALSRGAVDVVTFASASAVRGYVDAVGADLARTAPAVAIGPATAAAVRDAGMPLAGEAAEASVSELAAAVVHAVRPHHEAVP